MTVYEKEAYAALVNIAKELKEANELKRQELKELRKSNELKANFYHGVLSTEQFKKTDAAKHIAMTFLS